MSPLPKGFLAESLNRPLHKGLHRIRVPHITHRYQRIGANFVSRFPKLRFGTSGEDNLGALSGEADRDPSAKSSSQCRIS